MQKRKIALYILPLLISVSSQAQIYTLYSSAWKDMNAHSTSPTHSTIYIDSSMITIEQGESHLYLEISKQTQNETTTIYNVLDYNDQPCLSVFSPDDMQFDFKSNQFFLRYMIDSIVRPHKEVVDTVPKDSLSVANEDSVEHEDSTIYDKTDLMPEFPGGKEAMAQWLTDNVKYPADAKRDKLTGVVTVSALIEKDGHVSEVKVKHDIGGGCGAEAVRAIKQMPNWIPGEIGDEEKRVRVPITIVFPPK